MAIVVIGETPYAEGMGDIRDAAPSRWRPDLRSCSRRSRPEPYGSTLELAELHPEDLETIRTIARRGHSGRGGAGLGQTAGRQPGAGVGGRFRGRLAARLGGPGVADVLFGDYDFQGKLSFSWPGGPGDNYNRGDGAYDPLFPYGFGLTLSG